MQVLKCKKCQGDRIEILGQPVRKRTGPTELTSWQKYRCRRCSQVGVAIDHRAVEPLPELIAREYVPETMPPRRREVVSYF